VAVSRAEIVDARFVDHVRRLPAPALLRDDLDAPVRPGSGLRARDAIALFDVMIESRWCDLVSRELKNAGRSFYTIGSSGHEGNAAVAWALRPDDPAFLHYRSGGFFLARARQHGGPDGAFDILRGVVAAADEPIAGGRHKVFGSVELHIPPQTSTIASHLPKAVGCAVSIDRRARLFGEADDRIAVCTFGDASSNHSTATGAFNAAGWTDYQRVPCPVLFVCEDNGIGISVRTPEGWVGHAHARDERLAYFAADGLDLPDAYDQAAAAVAYVREHRRPAFLHVSVVRMLGHAGSDVEQLYRSREEIEAAEARDPLLRAAELLVGGGWMTPEAIVALYEDTRERVRALGREALRREPLTDAAEVMRPLFQHDEARVTAAISAVDDAARLALFGGALPEHDDRPRHLAVQINRALTDLFAAVPESILFGEDVARKGGVYHVTADLTKRFGVGRVFNSLLDEQAILGMAIGAGHAGLLPFPEIQYLAYLINAIDQLRGEAASLQYFSNGQYQNPMVVRIAGLAYQKGFGGHFHNDNGIGAVREIPGILLACPSRGDDAAKMLRTLAGAARGCGRVAVFLEPIALYMTKDLHEDGDGLWLTPYPEPAARIAVGEVGVYDEGHEGQPYDLTIASFANGLWMSLRVAKRLAARGVRARIIDLRWLHPLPIDALLPHAQASGRLLIVDECRRSSGIADTLFAEVVERDPTLRVRRVQAPDTYIPLGPAANLVLVSEADIEAGAAALLEAR
jgi:2-oxoisovalerate dehydrogenase E1 component